MLRYLQWLSVLALILLGHVQAHAQIHPKEALGRKIFDSFRNNQFSEFYLRSIFALEEDEFRNFLYGIKNHNLRQDLFRLHEQEFPPGATSPLEKWRLAFAHTWRTQWSHIARHSPRVVQADAYDPIMRKAKDFGIQWETVDLLAIEVLLPVRWEYGRFEIKRDPMPDLNSTDPRTVYLDRMLTYRLQLDASTHGNAWMIGYAPEDSEQLFNSGVIGNGSGQEDVLIRLSSQFPEKLHYFCPDEPGAGGPIEVKDFDSIDKPNQRTDILLTFSFGQPARFYQILIHEVLSTPKGEVFCERPEWLGEVRLPRGITLPD